MWASYWAVLAYAGTPANIHLDDIEKWKDAAEQLLDMPSGCWEWVGQASWDWHTGKYGKTRGDAIFAGKTQDGDWGEIALQPLGEFQQRSDQAREERVYADEARFVGERRTTEGRESAAMILGPHRPRAGRSLNEGRAKGAASQGAFPDRLWKDYPRRIKPRLPNRVWNGYTHPLATVRRQHLHAIVMEAIQWLG